MLESVPGTIQYLAVSVTFLDQGNNGSLWWGLNSLLTDNKSEALLTVPRRGPQRVMKKRSENLIK